MCDILPPAPLNRRGCSSPPAPPRPRPPPQSAFGRGRPSPLARSEMLDNGDYVVDTSPRELTQNPLRKIWMPCKNGHIAQRRGKMLLRASSAAKAPARS